MSIATATTQALVRFRRRQKGARASVPLPCPTNTTAPLSRSNTTVRYFCPLPMEISSMAIWRIRRGLALPDDGRTKLDRVAGWVVLLLFGSFFALGGVFWLVLLIALPG